MASPYDRDRLIALLKRDALRTGTFTLASGRTSHYYVDGRKVTLSAEGAAVIGAGVLDLLADLPGGRGRRRPDDGGRPDRRARPWRWPGAGPAGLRGFLVRKEAKGHGTGQLVEGPLGAGETVAIVDDVATTGGSSLQAVEAVEAMGCRVAGWSRARPPRRGRRGVRRPRARVPGPGHDPRPGRRAVAARGG